MLEHVECWDERRGWRWIGVEEASRRFPGGKVSKDEGYFRCSICQQNLTFAYSEVYRRYFTHTNGSTDCPDKASEEKYSNYCTERNRFRLDNRTLPLRFALNRENRTFNLEIGLAPLPEDLYRQACETQTKINIHYDLDGTDQKNTYLLASRLYELGTTYFPINDLAPQYRLTLSNAPKELNGYWAESTIDLTNGVLFDASSRKNVPPKGEIVVGRPYYYLGARQLSSYYGIDVQELPYSPVLRHSTFSKKLRCYRLEIKYFKPYTWEYAEDLGFRLAQSAPTMFPVWPPYVANSSLIFYQNYKVTNRYNYIFVKGDFGFKAFPIGVVSRIYSKKNSTDYIDDSPLDSYLAQVEFSGRGICGAVNTVLAGRDYDILKSLSFWKTELDSICRTRLPLVTITSDDVPLDKDVYSEFIPKKIVVKTEYDGFLDIIEHDCVINRLKLSSDVPYTFEPGYNQKIVVWQGREVVREISFLSRSSQIKNSTKSEDASPDDQELASRLALIHGNEIAIPWTLRSLLPEIKNRPLVTRWVLNAIRKGRAPQNALSLLRQTFS